MRDTVLRFRLRTPEKRAVEKWANRRDLTLSEFMRRAVKFYVASLPLEGFYDEVELNEQLKNGGLCNER